MMRGSNVTLRSFRSLKIIPRSKDLDGQNKQNNAKKCHRYNEAKNCERRFEKKTEF